MQSDVSDDDTIRECAGLLIPMSISSISKSSYFIQMHYTNPPDKSESYDRIDVQDVILTLFTHSSYFNRGGFVQTLSLTIQIERLIYSGPPTTTKEIFSEFI